MKPGWCAVGICILILLIGVTFAAVCPESCECLTDKDAKERGMVSCEEKKISCGETKAGEALYCFRNNTTQVGIITGVLLKPALLTTLTITPTPTPTATIAQVSAVKTLSPTSITTVTTAKPRVTPLPVTATPTSTPTLELAIDLVQMQTLRVTPTPTLSLTLPEEGMVVGTVLLGGDSDGDGVGNLVDVCPDDPDPEQLDTDGDGIGDVCDSCSVPFAGGESYCCDQFYSPSGISCRDLSRYSVEEGRDVYYWEDQYDLVDSSGCGCGDSDGGMDPFTHGWVYVEECETSTSPAGPPGSTRPFMTGGCSCQESGEDHCSADGNTLIEYVCTEEGVMEVEIPCPGGCRDGVCSCSDSDGGVDYYEAGAVGTMADQCINDETLREYSCGYDESRGFYTDSTEYTCPNGCRDGACLCEDTDGGVDYEVAGCIGTHCDTCEDDRWLVEYQIEAGTTTRPCNVHSYRHQCEGLCVDGACQPPSCTDGIQNQGEEDIDCGGPCPSCSLCSDIRSGAASLPERFDWRAWNGVNWITDIRDQGHCGSCWAHAALASMEAVYNIETGTNHGLNLSEQYFVSDCCRWEGDCGGGYISRVLYNAKRQEGVTEEDYFPYEARDTSCRPASGWEDDTWEIDDYDRIDPLTGDNDINEIKREIICKGPVASGGGGHAVLLIGWDDSTREWIIKNSWGTGWGTNGFGQISYNNAWADKVWSVDGVSHK